MYFLQVFRNKLQNLWHSPLKYRFSATLYAISFTFFMHLSLQRTTFLFPLFLALRFHVVCIFLEVYVL